jgi:SEC-C motif-containing protein
VSAFGTVSTTACPCGNEAAYAACCEPLHLGVREARTAEELMRSRFAAYVRRDERYLMRTWHPRTRPAQMRLDGTPSWLRLTVLATADGRDDDRTGEVEFQAFHEGGTLYERSRFVRRAGHWVYVDGDLLD